MIHLHRSAGSRQERRTPTGQELGSHAMRSLAGIALVLLAAGLVNRMGYTDQQWQYLVIAGAILPQVLVDALAINDPERRSRLRTSVRPAPVPMLGAVVLLVAADMVYAPGQAAAVVVAAAAVCAAVGLALAASPTSIGFAPR